MFSGSQRLAFAGPQRLVRSTRLSQHAPLGFLLTTRVRFSVRLQSTSAATAIEKKADTISVLGTTYSTDEWTNATPTILEKTGRNLLHQHSHPLAILKELIFKEFPEFAHYDNISPVVSTYQNFDSLGFSEDHPGRSATDTYYINQKTLLRTHTSAHQLQLLAAGKQKDDQLLRLAKNRAAAPMNERFLVAADVYRRDEIDASHYPVFHQMEGVCTFSRAEVQDQLRQKALKDAGSGAHGAEAAASQQEGSVAKLSDSTEIGKDNPVQPEHTAEEAAFVAEHMKKMMNNMVVQILTKAVAAQKSTNDVASKEGRPEFPVRWIDAFFPFTSPSWEMEVFFQGEWLEICGCGVMKQSIMDDAGMSDRIGWAFGFGLERLAMLLFGIPDIRLFWSTDPRFTDQFAPDRINTFKQFSRHPACTKDVSFWLPTSDEFHENDLMDLVRETAGDLVEGVKLIDSFAHPKSGKTSRCYRINYCSMDRNVTNEEINAIQDHVRELMVNRLGVALR